MRYADIIDRLKEKEMQKWDLWNFEREVSDKCSISCPTCQEILLEYVPGVFSESLISLYCTSCDFDLVVKPKKHFLMKIAV